MRRGARGIATDPCARCCSTLSSMRLQSTSENLSDTPNLGHAKGSRHRRHSRQPRVFCSRRSHQCARSDGRYLRSADEYPCPILRCCAPVTSGYMGKCDPLHPTAEPRIIRSSSVPIGVQAQEQRDRTAVRPNQGGDRCHPLATASRRAQLRRRPDRADLRLCVRRGAALCGGRRRRPDRREPRRHPLCQARRTRSRDVGRYGRDDRSRSP